MKETPLLMCGEMVLATLQHRKNQTRRVIRNLRVHVPKTVRADVPSYGCAKPGFYKAQMNPLGAVSCDIGGGRMLGLKPGEFNFVCPYCYGKTELTDSGWVIRPRESRLWVKETWATSVACDDRKPSDMEKPGRGYGWPVWYRADNGINLRGRAALEGGPGFTTRGKGRPSIFMPRWASRITPDVALVRIQHVQDISEQDAVWEGIKGSDCWEQTTPEAKTLRDPIWAYHKLWDALNVKRGYSWDSNPWVWAITFKCV